MLLEIANLESGYGSTPVLHGVSLEVDAGEIVAVLGLNGAGKTTLLRTISGLLEPTAGSITLDGTELAGHTAEQIVALGIAHSPEGRGVFPALSVEENLRLGGYLLRHRGPEYRENLEKVFTFFPVLGERRGQLAGTLSGGEQQMLAVGRAMMSSPRVLLIDEASLGLAPIIVQRLFGIVQEINASGTTILMVEQNASFALRIAHRAFLMQKGTIVFSGTGEELAKTGVSQAYLGGVAAPGNGSKPARKRAPARRRR